MSSSETIVGGTLQPDGTLILDSKPNLPPGRVTVVLRLESANISPFEDDWIEFLLSARKRMDGAKCHFTNDAEAPAHVDWLRESDLIDNLLRDAGERRRKADER